MTMVMVVPIRMIIYWLAMVVNDSCVFSVPCCLSFYSRFSLFLRSLCLIRNFSASVLCPMLVIVSRS